jgi:hypothetical protein
MTDPKDIDATEATVDGELPVEELEDVTGGVGFCGPRCINDR